MIGARMYRASVLDDRGDSLECIRITVSTIESNHTPSLTPLEYTQIESKLQQFLCAHFFDFEGNHINVRNSAIVY